ncbi:MAG: Asp-tRNA(Asn)/Glu-tRNA(Gln) amidotransferase subunit GatB, partial [Planctomycetaceae bacterium]
TPVPARGRAPARRGAVVALVESGGVARVAAARDVLPRLLAGTEEPAAVVQALGLQPVEEDSVLRAAAAEAVAGNPHAAADVRAGKEKAFGALMGAVMRRTQGKANPDAVRRVLKEILEMA